MNSLSPFYHTRVQVSFGRGIIVTAHGHTGRDTALHQTRLAPRELDSVHAVPVVVRERVLPLRCADQRWGCSAPASGMPGQRSVVAAFAAVGAGEVRDHEGEGN